MQQSRPRRGRLALRPALVAIIALCATVYPASADSLDTIRERGVLIWGGDQEGGGPFMYPDPDHPDRLLGFEVELADVLARHLGVQARFFQGAWDTLPQFLESGQIDIVLNGYEWTPDRAAQMLASDPYYIYELQLMARTSDDRITTIEDLAHPPGGTTFSVGALEGSAAATYLREKFPGTVRVRAYDGNTNAMLAVSARIDDATLQDLPIAIFYGQREPGEGLRFAGEPVAPGRYVIYARKEDQSLITAINQAIARAYIEGDLKCIYSKYGIWNDTQEKLAAPPPPMEKAKVIRGLAVFQRYLPIMSQAALMTVGISVMSMPLAVLAGLLIALGRMYGRAWLRWPLGLHVELLRGTPVMLQLLVLYFLVPRLLPFDSLPWLRDHWPVIAAVLGLAINYSAYEAEIYRAGLQAIPQGQMEAALALGMTRRTALRRVIVPQAIRIVVPPVTNDFIALFKDTSICSVIAVVELTKQYGILANSTGAVFELAVMTAGMYLMMSYPLSLVARRLEQKFAGGPAR